MKIVMLCGDSPNQVALANLLHQELGVDKLIVWSPVRARNNVSWNFINLGKRLFLGLISLQYRRAWFGMLSHFSKLYSSFPITPLVITSDINSPEVANLIMNLEDTLIVVSGTNLLSESLLNLIQEGSKVINLHTGISPYVKGGPNCTNWCLANNQLDRIGNTVMWIDSGIDSGNLISTEQTDLKGVNSLLELHIRVMEHAHILCIRAITQILSGKTVPSVPQENFAERNLFLSKDWVLVVRIKGLVHFWIRFKFRRNASLAKEKLELVSL